MVLILRSLMIRLQRRHAYMEKARACRAIVKKYALSTEDVCIKLLTAAENDPALARLVRSKSSSHSSPLTHSSQSYHGFSREPESTLVRRDFKTYARSVSTAAVCCTR
jgi:hypothetical protein